MMEENNSMDSARKRLKMGLDESPSHARVTADDAEIKCTKSEEVGSNHARSPQESTSFIPGASASKVDARYGPQESASIIPGASTSQDPSGTSDAGSSNSNKLPHWLQDVVSVTPPPPHHVPAAPALPPSASAVAQSLNLLDGAENSEVRMPPFSIFHPGSSPSKDPALNLNKQNKKESRNSGFGLRIRARAGAVSGSGTGVGTPSEYLEYLELNSPLTLGQESKLRLKDPAVNLNKQINKAGRMSGLGLCIGARDGVPSGSGADAGAPPEYLEYLDLISPLTLDQKPKREAPKRSECSTSSDQPPEVVYIESSSEEEKD